MFKSNIEMYEYLFYCSKLLIFANSQNRKPNDALSSSLSTKPQDKLREVLWCFPTVIFARKLKHTNIRLKLVAFHICSTPDRPVPLVCLNFRVKLSVEKHESTFFLFYVA